MKALQPVRGTRDLIGDDARRHFRVVDTARRVTALYGASEWATPIFESTAVFARTLGETSDVVTKEMYTFEDRSGESITLRPEATAGICRAVISNGLTQTLPQKIFFQGPMFRYERPQKGRYRQFHQIDFEIIGAAEPLADAEAIACGWQILRELGIADGTVLNINTLGDKASRDAYRTALVDYLSRYEADLSADSRTRLARNPLRILDSKDSGDIALLAAAPVIYDHLNAESAAFYDGVKSALAQFGIPFVENPRIVRGFDYYNHTAFEFVTTELGAQGTVLGGGRYDGLMEQMGGPSIPGIGWGAGIERLAMLLADVPEAASMIAVIPMGEAQYPAALGILNRLRNAGIAAEMAYRGNVKRRMERANRIHARAAIIIGEDELARDAVAVKFLDDGTQREVAIGDLAALLR
ncbi:histidine--tRNA ligase [Acidiphilium sp. AL]|uniref:Histidine--tRNA ligase n=1 Tax=Acidiphilium iwatense TaxID=768198 RepID=A0ABS9DUW0_9PROT|nr:MULTISPECIES: histidine--tRNA ligase [Acidiphilium]MCF3946492.1 histidine--tRNA ligase [Acidiphilium iwatense]MCU4158662.1 histidine--tRNA ligase [Acidiphilium sp. AL]